MDPQGEQINPPVNLPEQVKTPDTESVEQLPAATPEKSQPQKAERSGATINQAPAAPALSLPPLAPPAVAPASTDDSAATGDSNSPTIADDLEVIEKEWVDKAREIVRQTKGDPYRQEQAVESLHRAYLKKRYNRDLKSSSQLES